MTVCLSGSMSLAAQRLGVSQSAVSQMVKGLEQEFGVQLLDREVRPARTTRAGELLLEMADGLLADARTMANRLRQSVHQDHAQIRLGCVDSFAATVGPALIRALSASARQLQLWSGLTPGLNAQLLARDLDLAVCTEVPSDTRISHRLLFSESWVAVFPPGVPMEALEHGRDLKSRAGALPLVRYTTRSVIGQQVDRYLRHIGLDMPQRFAFDATDPMLSVVAAGLGWAISTPLCLWQSRAWLEQVQVLALPPGRLGHREFHLLCRSAEWAQTANEVTALTHAALRRELLPELQAVMPHLGPEVLLIGAEGPDPLFR